ncbi:MAG: tetratricopeptide repeat protein, partial [Planctomycetes bacterium]|nr:tetratricopeptide repeat protein [Planctomycetota bacterium]
MSYLLEILGHGLLAELSAAFSDLLHDDGHFSTAELQQAIDRNPQAAEPYIALAARCLSGHDYAGARTALESALLGDPACLSARVGLACVCDALGQTESAVEHLERAHRDHPDDATVLFALGYCHEKLARLDQAVAEYTACLAVAPNLRNAHERLAAINLKQDQLDEAIHHYEQICWYEPGEVVPLLTLANLFIR